MEKNYIPKGYYQDENGKLCDTKGTIVCDVIPMVEELKKVKKRKGKVIYEKIVLKWLGVNARSETQEILVQDIRDGTFIKNMPTNVIVDPSYSKKIRDIFRYIILSQMMNKESEDVEEYEFGWNGLHYYWEIEEEQKGHANSEYEAVVSIADILSKGEDAISAMLLAAIHGPLIKVLREAGINQDFLTLVVGASGVGKTELAKIFCDYLPHKKVVFSLGSNRKELQKMLERIADITCVIDDYNLTASNRVKERQLQILSEIIQSRSNAGKLLVDEDSEQYEENEVHVVATSETIIRNVSSLNRCFLVQMDTPIANELWNKIQSIRENEQIFTFIRAVVSYVEQNYEEAVKRCKANFRYYQEQTVDIKMSVGNSGNRIINIMAVQLTLKSILMDYFLSMNLDSRLRQKVDKSITACVYSCGKEVAMEINTLQKKSVCMRLLPILAEIIVNEGNKYELAESEKIYNRDAGKERCRPYLGVCVNYGYVSFFPSCMCKLIADELRVSEDTITTKELGKELSYYSLARIDTEHKVSNRWNTKKRMYHVRVKELLDLVYADDEPYWHESTVQKFEGGNYW